MKKALKYIGSVVVVIAACLFILSFMSNEKPIKYVSMSSVFQESKMRVNFEKDLALIEQESNSKLREMNEELKQKEKSGADQAQLKFLRDEMIRTREVLTNDYQEKSQEFEEIVWKSINKSIKKYGKEKGYKFILGATGDGAIMYADDSEDITKEIVKIINKK